MEQVKIFEDGEGKDLEKQINDWLSENAEKVVVIDRRFISNVNSVANLKMAIFYTPKH